MAKKSDSESFMDMFSKLGSDLKMPSVDVEALLAHHRKNLEALEKSARATASGASEAMGKQREALQNTLQDITEMAQSFKLGTDPQEMMAKQVDFARKSFETAVKNASDIGEVLRKSGGETVDILRQRIKDAMEEIRETYDKNTK